MQIKELIETDEETHIMTMEAYNQDSENESAKTFTITFNNRVGIDWLWDKINKSLED